MKNYIPFPTLIPQIELTQQVLCMVAGAAVAPDPGEDASEADLLALVCEMQKLELVLTDLVLPAQVFDGQRLQIRRNLKERAARAAQRLVKDPSVGEGVAFELGSRLGSPSTPKA